MKLKLAASICFAWMASLAQGAPAYPTGAETKQLLQNGQFDVLDKQYGGIQSAYRDGAITDIELRAAFRTFYDTDLALEKPFEKWVEHSPRSYVAHLARGIYFRFVGDERRGTDFASNTSAIQFDAMRAAHEVAAKELETSLRLEQKPILTYLNQIEIERNRGNAAGMRQLLDRAVKIDPHTFIMREKYMDTLTTRWGGSTAAMWSFFAECARANLPDDQVRALKSQVLDDEERVKEQSENAVSAAITSSRETADADALRDCDACGQLYQAATYASEHFDYKNAVELYSKLLLRKPELIGALNGRGLAYSQLAEFKSAAQDFRKSAVLGDAEGQTKLAEMLFILAPHLQPSHNTEALDWLKKAVAQGYIPAKEVLDKVTSHVTESPVR